MELIIEVNLQNVIKDGLKNSISYSQYRREVETLVANNATSGDEQSLANINYTLLNDRRMKRWDKTIKVNEEVKKRLSALKKNVTWLVLTESWCGDAAHVIPVMNKITELSEHISLRLVYRDKNKVLMDQFLTNGSKSIPKLIMIDDVSGDVLDTYGPRPSNATQLALDYKNRHGVLTAEFKEELQHWYNADKGENTIENLLELLKV